MGTRCVITVHCQDGKYRAVQVNYDGHPRPVHGVGYKLIHYNSQALAEAVVALGMLSELGTTLASQAEAGEEGTVAYHRDRGESLEIGVGVTAKEAATYFDDHISFDYLWEKGEWKILDARSLVPGRFIPLIDVVESES